MQVIRVLIFFLLFGNPRSNHIPLLLGLCLHESFISRVLEYHVLEHLLSDLVVDLIDGSSKVTEVFPQKLVQTVLVVIKSII